MVYAMDVGSTRPSKTAPKGSFGWARASGWDIKELEQLWRNWIEKMGTLPDKPDVAFLGFVRKHTRSKRR